METDQPGGAPGSSAPPPAPPSPSAEKLSDGEKFLEDLKNDPESIRVLVAILVGVLTVVLLLLWTRRRLMSRGRVVALLGTCEAGKTVMFSKLVHGKGVETYTSTKENKGLYTPFGGSRPLEVCDLPGHERLRQHYMDDAKRRGLRAIVFLVDASSLQRQLRDVAEFLFGLLSDRAVAAAAVPVAVACNKQDLPLAKGGAVIRRELEKEFQLLREIHARSLGGTDGDSGQDTVYLGQEGKEFSFDDLKNEVGFVETSSLGENGLKELEDFLAKVA